MNNTKIEITEGRILDNGELVSSSVLNVSVEAIQNKEELDQFFKTVRGAAESLWPSEPTKGE